MRAEIENFLNIINEAKKYGYNITSKFVYSNLIYINVESKGKINDNFDYWKSYYRNVADIDCFVSENWKYFCQFKNNEGYIQPNEYLKMYIPLDKEHIKYGATIIFDYLAKNNIEHTSKIGSDVRNDDIVVRVRSIEDAYKLSNYINSNEYLKEGSIKTNPFTFRDGIIAYTWDGNLSYNSVVSYYVKEFINSLDLNEKPSFDKFYLFMLQKNKNLFVDGTKLNELSDELGGRMDSYLLADYKLATQMFMQSMNSKNKVNDFYKLYGLYSNDELYYNETNNMEQLKERNNSHSQREVWNSIYQTMVNKFGVEETNLRIQLYISSGQVNYFTRDNNARQNLISYNITPEVLSTIIYDNDMKVRM